jgi:plasmid stabilization system protein ParE
VKLRLSEEAQRDIETVDAWWREHRPAAPLLFRQELRAAIQQIETSPESGTPFLGAKKPYRRVILPKSRYLLYYEYDKATGVLAVASIWSARRSTNPNL